MMIQGSSSSSSNSRSCRICPTPTTSSNSISSTSSTTTTIIPEPWSSIMPRPEPKFLLRFKQLHNQNHSNNDNDDHNNNNNQNNITCQQWFEYIEILGRLFQFSQEDCIDLKDYLQGQCCFFDSSDPDRGGHTETTTSMRMPLYQCRSNAYKAVLSNSYEKHLAPIISRSSPVVVGIEIQLDSVEVIDHGINGGSISTAGSLSINWKDDRLRWYHPSGNTTEELDCWSFPVPNNEIWRPTLAKSLGEDEETEKEGQVLDLPRSTTTVLADGRVIWNDENWYETLQCQTVVGTQIKRCSLTWLDLSGRGDVSYKPQDVVITTDDDSVVYIEGYKLNHTASSVVFYDNDEDGADNHHQRTIQLVLQFDPLENDCNICGDDKNTTLIPDAIPTSRLWLDKNANTVGWTCYQLDNYLTNLTNNNPKCLAGRAFLEEACCDDTRSTFECESSIHDKLADLTNTITPPDPSLLESNRDEASFSEDFVDVSVHLDIAHIVEINIRENTMKLLLSLELEWYDQRLNWQPWLGGCPRASFRASEDAELTEIWVPNIELVNMIEGTSALPEARASVMYDGHVIWTRKGVVTVACDLSGIHKFPFDTSGCDLDFGGTRNPLFHRVKWIAREVEYSSRLSDDSWNYQEYRLIPNRTTIDNVTEELSGFKNELIRYNLYFERATNYYVKMFVLLYVIFTILSFGMFFIDLRLGERIGYGSSILFVMVAQDITMAEFTPVTNEPLWIYQLSLGSKIFAIAGIIQSIACQYYLTNYLIGEEGGQASQHPASDYDEIRPILKVDAECPQSSDVEANDDVVDNGSTAVNLRKNEASSIPGGQQPARKQQQHDKRSQQGNSLRSSIMKVMPKAGSEDLKTEIAVKWMWLVDKITATVFVLAYTIFLLVLYEQVW